MASFPASVSAALRAAPVLPITDEMVSGCLDPAGRREDILLMRAWQDSLATLPPAERRGRLAGATGHLGESVVEVILDSIGYSMLWHFSGPLSGGHGVDLVVLSPAGQVITVEVKATLRPQRWPRPSRGELAQMTAKWIDKADNPGMANWDLSSDDVYGAIAVVNFAARGWRCAVTADFVSAHPVQRVDDLADVGWIPSVTSC
jgi:hypothetical protein